VRRRMMERLQVIVMGAGLAGLLGVGAASFVATAQAESTHHAAHSASDVTNLAKAARHTDKEPSGTAMGVAEKDEGYVGVFVSAHAADVVAEVDGVVEDMLAALGDRVKNGQSLVKLSVEQAQLDLTRAKAEQQAARAALKYAQIEQRHAVARAKRLRKLVDEGLASEEELSKARYEVAETKVQVAQARSVLEERGARTNQLRAIARGAEVEASFDGVVAIRYVDAGTRVAPGTPLLRLISQQELLLRFAIPEHVELRVGQPVVVESTTGERRRLHAKVVRLAPEIDSASRMRTIEAQPDQPKEVVAAGLVGAIVVVRQQKRAAPKLRIVHSAEDRR